MEEKINTLWHIYALKYYTAAKYSDIYQQG